MLQQPTSHKIDPDTGRMENATGAYRKRIADLSGVYLDEAAFLDEAGKDPDRVVYTVFETRPEQERGDLIFGTTHMAPGRIGDEYFLTRGHIHATANRPEAYTGLRGAGLMQMESPDGETVVLDVKPGVLVYVPPYWLHRSINIGSEPLVMSFCYPSDSGQDYAVIGRSGGMAKRIIAQGDGWEAVDNPTYRKRNAEEVSRIMETSN
ncbi:MAG: glucose-6-phosphate isomerase family protein [Alphaproteobacteria bacterium]|nr:glucose-6-phosphate isomerase family protein [Alphaproteobacteria bacterium]